MGVARIPVLSTLLGALSGVLGRSTAPSSRDVRAFLDAAPDATVVVGADGLIRYANAGMVELLGYQIDELVGRHVDMLVPDSVRPRHSALREGFQSRPARRSMGSGLHLAARHKDGHDIPVEISLGPVETSAGRVTVAALRDATQKRETEAALTRAQERYRLMSEQDPLTGLANRRGFEKAFIQHLELCRSNVSEGALLYVDLDHFKEVNDSLGHDAGDRLLIAVSDAMRAALRDTDVISRQGGDEFLVLLHRAEPVEAVAVAERIVDAVRQEALRFGEASAAVSASAGVVMMADLRVEDVTTTTLMSRADTALYEAKAAGRNRVSVFRPEPSGA
ncbi:GGDEF domain-containing protein [Nocardioides sp. Kera G14]|uniref:GGDEF domain-containing protein n=1 Tax=Nocardioides sp. Kera G14 TaxID=2884264 RepID=UPI001D126395|nr:sensor domain-containing diguanylate cyclase [Nocardioides sp. Kera G14]UDY22911.1 sensor domain-containing diguanylate cyclase [Nocardioides sp. Kera G14]